MLLPTTLFWMGVSLAPLAGLVVWFARGGGPLRAAAVMAILGTVLIGLSVALRRDDDRVRLELQENLLAEMDAVRAELGAELGAALDAAAQHPDQSLQAEVAELRERVEALASAQRRRADVLRGDPSGRRPLPGPVSDRGTRAEQRRPRGHRHRAED